PTTKTIFSQKQLSGKQFSIWTKRWKMPFTIDSFFYISDGRALTYIIYDASTEEIAEELTDKFSGFPKTFKVDKLREDQLDKQTLASIRAKATDYAKIRFAILSSKQPALYQGAEKIKLESAEIEGEETWEYGTVEYGSGDTSIFLGKEMLIGAILAEDQESYEKSKEKAMEKLTIMSRLYGQKAGLLEKTCPQEYISIKQKLKTLEETEPDQSTLENFALQVEDIKNANRQFEGGCPEVF
ncbi:MAG: hypothetical protein V1914_01825, partial [archaeon]